MAISQVRQVITGQAAVEGRELGRDQFALGVGDLAGSAINTTDSVVSGAQNLQLLLTGRSTVQTLATQQHGVKFEHVVTGFAVFAAALAAGIGGDHAADGGAVGGGKIRSKKQPVGLECGVELVLDHTGLYPNPAPLDIDIEDLVHVPRHIHHQAVGKRLAIGAGAATARGEHYPAMPGVGSEAGNTLEIFNMARIQHRLGQALIDRVIGGQHRTVGIVRGDFACEARRLQSFKESQVVRSKRGNGAGVRGVESCDHVSLHGPA